MVDSEKGVPVPERKGMKRTSVFAIIVVLVIAGGLIYLYYPYNPSGPINPGPGNQTYTKAEIEAIVSNLYPYMREMLISKNDLLASCVAATRGNSSVCLQLENDSKDCLQDYNLHFSFGGECEKLVAVEESPINFGVFCSSLKLGTCEGLEGKTGIICEAVLNNDLARCMEFPGINEKGCIRVLNTFLAMKEADAEHCNGIPDDYSRERCIAFVSGSCEKTIEDIANGWSIFSLSRESGNLTICSYIIPGYIRELCEDENMGYEQAIRII